MKKALGLVAIAYLSYLGLLYVLADRYDKDQAAQQEKIDRVDKKPSFPFPRELQPKPTDTPGGGWRSQTKTDKGGFYGPATPPTQGGIILLEESGANHRRAKPSR